VLAKTFRHHLKSSLVELGPLGDAFCAFTAGNYLPSDVQFAAQLALDEIVSNVVRHGYQGRDDGSITVEAAVSSSELTIRVIDSAPPFDPLKAAEPDVTVPLEDRMPGGLGVHLTRKMMDRLEYAYIDGTNVFTMHKRLSTGPPPDHDVTPPPYRS
jgi:serine/threonine-protein kinase RsbW